LATETSAINVKMTRSRPWLSGDRAFRGLVYASAILLVLILAAMIYELVGTALPAFKKFHLDFLTGTTWDPVKEIFGALPVLYGTLASAIIALIFVVPMAIGCAIFLAELAPGWLRVPVSFVIEMLAAIPSVIFGLWGLFVLVPFVRDPIERVLGDHLAFIPLFDGPPFGFGLLAAGIMLAIMTLPIVTAVSRDVFLAVPHNQREAMLALGATRWETISRAVIPYARSGLVGAVILGLGRAMGETMAVTMVIGNGFKISPSLFEPTHTIASIIASEFNEATGELHRAALTELALVLLVMSLVVNVVARVLVVKFVKIPGRIRE
jgi:phosphate transport system permease protein